MRRLRIGALAAVVFVVFAAATSFAGHALMGSGQRLHWGDNEPNFPRGYMYWHDHTGSEWPVFASAIEWDKAGKLDAVYVSGSSSCTSFRCVPVREVDFNNSGCASPYGEASYTYLTSNGHFQSASARVDAQCDSRNAADRRELVCHEMGHTIGLDERPSSNDTSCMRQGNMNGEQLPDDHDFNALQESYSHDA